MVITKIEVQKKKQGRYTIYLDGAFAFGVDEATLIKFALAKGRELTNEEIKAIEAEDAFQIAYQKALRFLNFQLRTTKEVYDKLEKMAIEESIIERVLQVLVEHGFLNDRFYAESFVNQALTVSMKGPKQVAFDLKQKGVAIGIIHEVLACYDESIQFTNALEIGQKYVERQGQVSTKVAQHKVYTYLMQRGYEPDVIQTVVNELSYERQEQEADDLVLKQARQALQRYSKKYKAQQLWYQVKGNLFQKGFTIEAIDRAIALLQEEWEGCD